MLKLRLLAALLCLLPLSAQAALVEDELPGAQMRGEATFRYFGIPIYDARLYTISGAPLDWEKDFALELTYRRKVSQRALVESTLQEFRRIGNALPLRTELSVCFSDVADGDRYMAISNGPDEVSFWRNEILMCRLRYPASKTRFMGIFLGDNTRSPSFTGRLLGEE